MCTHLTVKKWLFKISFDWKWRENWVTNNRTGNMYTLIILMKWYVTEEKIDQKRTFFNTSMELANKISIIHLMTDSYLLREPSAEIEKPI